MAHLYIIRGLPGSGKTTFARGLKAGLEAQGRICLHYEADMHMEVDGVYRFDPSKLSEAHGKCLHDTIQALEHGHTVIVSNTFVRLWEVGRYLSSVPVGTMVTILTMEGDYGNIHGVSPETMERMRRTFEHWAS